jgi:hypothetical protein
MVSFAAGAVQRVVAEQAVEAVAGGVADDPVGQHVAAAVDRGRADQRQVLDLVTERVVDRGQHEVDAAERVLDDQVGGEVHAVDVVAHAVAVDVDAVVVVDDREVRLRTAEDGVGRARQDEGEALQRAGLEAVGVGLVGELDAHRLERLAGLEAQLAGDADEVAAVAEGRAVARPVVHRHRARRGRAQLHHRLDPAVGLAHHLVGDRQRGLHRGARVALGDRQRGVAVDDRPACAPDSARCRRSSASVRASSRRSTETVLTVSRGANSSCPDSGVAPAT